MKRVVSQKRVDSDGIRKSTSGNVLPDADGCDVERTWIGIQELRGLAQFTGRLRETLRQDAARLSEDGEYDQQRRAVGAAGGEGDEGESPGGRTVTPTAEEDDR